MYMIYQRLLIKKQTLTIFNYTDCVNCDRNEQFQDRFHFEFNVLDKRKKTFEKIETRRSKGGENRV